jgi:carboxyl-terminal processing protease
MGQTMKKRIVVTTAVAVFAFLSGGWLMQKSGGSHDSVYRNARLFDDVISHVSDFYVDSVGESQLYRMAIDGLLSNLRDPYTGFLDGRDLQRLSEQTSGNYGGVGLQIDKRDGAIVVVAPLPETPAESAGVSTGDRIVAVNDSSSRNWTQEQAVAALRGTPGTRVRITIDRPGSSSPINITLTRARIHSRAVRLATMLEGNVGYIELFGFSQATARELARAVDSLRGAGMRALVLDLRFNPGGLLDEGVSVSDLFLDPGQQIVVTRGRAPDANRTIADRAPQRYAGMPLVVLVNGASASASEIVAGALQDHDRALVVGTTTYGKGLVQSVYRLSSQPGSEVVLKLTTARWFTPSGRTIQRTPRGRAAAQEAAEARDPDEELPLALRDTADVNRVYRTDAGRAMRGGGGITPDVVVRPDSAVLAAREALTNALDSNVTRFTDAVAAFALDVRARRAVSGPTFTVTPAMREQFLALLRARGVNLDAATLRVAGTFIDQQLGAQTARFTFGRTGEVQRLAGGDDPVLAQALRMARTARSQSELLSMAAAPAPEPATARAGRP